MEFLEKQIDKLIQIDGNSKKRKEYVKGQLGNKVVVSQAGPANIVAELREEDIQRAITKLEEERNEKRAPIVEEITKYLKDSEDKAIQAYYDELPVLSDNDRNGIKDIIKEWDKNRINGGAFEIGAMERFISEVEFHIDHNTNKALQYVYALKEINDDINIDAYIERINPEVKKNRERCKEVKKMKEMYEFYDLMDKSENENLSQIDRIHIKNRLAEIRSNQ